jgi:DNA-binding transcriptional MerR regulator
VTDASATEPADHGLMTIDQLAVRSGVSVRNIRFYAGKGLLPAPTLRGRLGLYGQEHLSRLELVSELSGLGFTLAAIERHLARLPRSLSPVELTLQRALLVPWVPERLEEVTPDELNRRVGRELDDQELESLEALGAVERQADGSVLLHGSAALSTALRSLEIGLPPEALRRLHAVIALHTSALAEDLMKLFQTDVLQPYRDRGRPAAERAALGELYSRMKPITVQGMVTEFGRAVNRTIREHFTKDADPDGSG